MAGFVDEAQLNVRGGDGGAGCVSMRREGPVAMGGPNGGDGGKGGDVWLVANRNVASLVAFKDYPHRRAGNGVHGQGKDMHGRRGEDLEIQVPEGTVVKDLYTGEVLADLVHHGDRWMAVAGGRGGRGNARFLSNSRRAPMFAEQGEEGEERWFKLELKLMADVALVGYPNAGKSTFISVISAAKPKIANYPFTTLEPHLGVVRMDDESEFVVADIPGLIEGAAEGKGLGHQFLRHIERALIGQLSLEIGAAGPLTGLVRSVEVDLFSNGANTVAHRLEGVGQRGGLRGQPDDAPVRAGAVAVALVEHGSTTTGDHEQVGRPAGLGQGRPLEGPEPGFAVGGEDLGDAAPGGRLHPVVDVDEGPAEPLGAPATDGRLARPHEPHQHEVTVAHHRGLRGSPRTRGGCARTRRGSRPRTCAGPLRPARGTPWSRRSPRRRARR